MPTIKRPAKKTAVVAVAQPVAQDEEPVEVAPAVAPADEEPEEVDAVAPADDEPSEEDTPAVKFMKSEKHRLTELKLTNLKKHFDTIEGKVKAIEAKEEALKEQMKALAEEKTKLRNDAHHKASEENIKVEIELKKCLAYLGEAKAQKSAERKPSAVKAPRSDGGLPYTKPLGLWRPDDDRDLCRTTTRLIFKQDSKKYNASWCCYALIDKQANKIYECDENGTRIGNEDFVSLNKFCYMVKSRVKFGGSMKQNIYDAMKYYDANSCQYSSLVHITEAVN
jgi:hypothetical protein